MDYGACQKCRSCQSVWSWIRRRRLHIFARPAKTDLEMDYRSCVLKDPFFTSGLHLLLIAHGDRRFVYCYMLDVWWHWQKVPGLNVLCLSQGPQRPPKGGVHFCPLPSGWLFVWETLLWYFSSLSLSFALLSPPSHTFNSLILPPCLLSLSLFPSDQARGTILAIAFKVHWLPWASVYCYVPHFYFCAPRSWLFVPRSKGGTGGLEDI